MSQQKIRVAVLYGGRSGEHEVSLVSATNVIQHLDRTLFDVIPIGIDKQGSWFIGDDVPLLQLQPEKERLLFEPEAIGKSLQPIQPTHLLPKKDHRLFDVVFPVIHGTLCEDGAVQGLLELAEVPYVGCGVLASAIGMDKDISKRLIENTGIAVAPYITLKQPQWEKNPAAVQKRIAEKLNYPLFVKPANSGSSVGIHKVHRPEELTAAVQDAFQYDVKILIEQGINAREIEVAVLESLDPSAEPIISIPGEIMPSSQHEFYSYASKYVDEKGATLAIPAVLSPELQEIVRQTAKTIFLALECEGMARVDLFMDRDTHQIYFNEINSIPGFTQISMYPKLMAASGMTYAKLLTHLVTLAMQRQSRKAKLSRDYISN